MTNERIKLKIEFVSWLMVGVLFLISMLPVFQIKDTFPFFHKNLIIAFVFLALARAILLFKFIPYLSSTRFRVFVLLLLPILFVYILMIHSEFGTFLQNELIEEHLKEGSWLDKKSTGNYVRSEFLFYSTGSLISIIWLGIRIVISLYRSKKGLGKI